MSFMQLLWMWALLPLCMYVILKLGITFYNVLKVGNKTEES